MTVLSLALAAPSAVADRPGEGSRGSDQELSGAQQAALDPQAETGDRLKVAATRGSSRVEREGTDTAGEAQAQCAP